jgi:hypothetical protein
VTDSVDVFALPASLVNASLPEFRTAVEPMTIGESLRRSLDDEISAVLQDAEATPLASAEHRIQLLDGSHRNDDDTKTISFLLRTLWRFIRAMNDLSKVQQIDRASADMREAAYGFAVLGRSEERDAAIGMGIYAQAILQLRSGNVGASSDQIETSRKFLENAGEFGSQFPFLPMADGMEVDLLAIQSQKAYVAGLQSDALAYLRTAAAKSKDIADNYYQDEDELLNLWLGRASLYEAWALYYESFICLSTYAFDRLPAELSKPAKEAIAYFTKSEPPGHEMALSTFFRELLEMAEELGLMMSKVFSATFKPNVGSFKGLHAHVDAARTVTAGEGDDLLPYLRSCDLLDDQLDNLERLAKPKRSDFGKFGGIIACVTFAPLLALFAIVNKLFSLGVDGALVVWTCTVLALIAGFGYGALKFRPLLPGARLGRKDR